MLHLTTRPRLGPAAGLGSALVLVACAREPSASTAAPDRIEGLAATTGSEATEGESASTATGDQDPSVDTRTADLDEADEGVESEVEDEDEEFEPIDMSPAAAPGLCEALVDEPGSLRGSAFLRGGLVISDDSRADVLECRSMDPMYGELTVAYLVIRVAGEEEPTTEELAEAYDVPGESLAYRLSRIGRRGGEISIDVTVTDTIYPDTGVPGSRRRDVERSRVHVVCTQFPEEREYACEKEERTQR